LKSFHAGVLTRRTIALIWAPGPTSYSLLQPPTPAAVAVAAVAAVTAVAVAAAPVAVASASRAFRVSSHLQVISQGSIKGFINHQYAFGV
jgi:hypothetical protein